MTDKSSAWKDKICAVTGGVGFIGSHLCARLHDYGAKVICVDICAGSEGTLFPLINMNNDISLITADLAEPSSIETIQDIQPDVIFHLAGLPYAPETTLHPTAAFRSNVITTANMLEAARRSDGAHFVLASSACYYGATTESPLKPNSRTSRGEHYYTYTKRRAEDEVATYKEFYNLSASVCRFVNVYGPGDRHFRRIVPSLCTQLIEGAPQSLQLHRSTGESIFEFLHVDDAVSGILAAGLETNISHEPLHFGPGKLGRTNILDLANRLSLIYDNHKRPVIVNNNTGERIVVKYLDTKETQQRLDWKANWSLTDGLKSTLDWYRLNSDRIAPITYTD
jgi:nucleoside-diphosphate-sugar epimerase